MPGARPRQFAGVQRVFVTINQHWHRFVRGRSGYPLFRRELAYWDQRLGGRWRLEETFAFITLANLCLLPVALLIFPNLLLGFALLDESLAWLAALPSATLIVREREGQTWDILRSTPLEGNQIALNKLSGLLYVIWESASYLVSARWYGTMLALPLLALMLVLRHSFPLAADQSFWIGLGLLLAYVGFIYRPQFNLLYGSSLGLAVSAFSHASSDALAWALILFSAHLVVNVSGLLAFRHFNLTAALFSESVLATRLESIFIWLIPLGLITLVRGLLTPLCLWLAIVRLQYLTH